MSRGILGSLFDLNRDGNVDSWERAIEMMAIDDMEREIEKSAQMCGEDDGLVPDDYDF